ncbi:MAG TPA: transposase, partial [Desulfosporosinus sp.]|nr:transposase [Desulfosporosinus sp.]
MIQGINFYHNGGAVELALVPGRDYPNTYRGFVEMFPDDTACAAFLIRLRWPEGFICPA